MQSICDGQLNHVADELLYRGDPTLNVANVYDDHMATARACNVAFYETGVESLVGNRNIFVNMPRDWLLKPDLLPPESDRIVIEVLESVVGDTDILDALNIIKDRGYKIALDDFVLNSKTEPLLDIADIIKVDMLQPYNAASVAEYKSRDKILLAEKVEDIADFDDLKDDGFTLFQGYFYSKPEIISDTSRVRSTNYGVLLQLLAELQNGDLLNNNLVLLIEQDPELAFLMLKYANSALYKRTHNVLNLFEAVYILGIKQIRAIALTILFANNGPINRLMLSRVLRRAYMSEILAKGIMPSEEAFVVGLMSMMDIMLGKPLDELLKQLSFSKELTEAIIEHKHQLGRLLKSIIDFESANIGGWSSRRLDRYNKAYLNSQVQANKVLNMVDNL